MLGEGAGPRERAVIGDRSAGNQQHEPQPQLSVLAARASNSCRPENNADRSVSRSFSHSVIQSLCHLISRAPNSLW